MASMTSKDRVLESLNRSSRQLRWTCRGTVHRASAMACPSSGGRFGFSRARWMPPWRDFAAVAAMQVETTLINFIIRLMVTRVFSPSVRLYQLREPPLLKFSCPTPPSLARQKVPSEKDGCIPSPTPSSNPVAADRRLRCDRTGAESARGCVVEPRRQIYAQARKRAACVDAASSGLPKPAMVLVYFRNNVPG